MKALNGMTRLKERRQRQILDALEKKHRKSDRAPAWKPIPDSPQELAYNYPVDELFYGGAGGAGKSDLLLGLAGTRQRRSLILRREFPRVRALIERSREIFASGVDNHAKDSFNESLHLWRLASGRTIELGSAQFEKDWVKYQGRDHDLKAFDELTEFSESLYRNIIIWNRTADPSVRCRVVATGNPPTTVEGEWVIDYWAPWLDAEHPDPAEPGDLVWYVRMQTADGDFDQEIGRTPKAEVLRHVAAGTEPDRPFIEVDGKRLEGRSRTFIGGRVEDNPYLMATGYDRQLEALPEELRIRFREGKFLRVKNDQNFQVVPTAWVDAAMARWTDRPPVSLICVGVDPARGGEDRTAIACRHGDWFAVESWRGAETPDGPSVAKLVLAIARGTPAVNVDVIGVGGSVVDALAQLKVPRVTGLNAAAAAVTRDGKPELDATGKIGFVNQRSLWYWRLREMLDPQSDYAIALPPDKKLRSELCAATWSLSGWKIAVESKDSIKKKLGRSPDLADAIVYASLPTPRSPSSAGGSGRRIQSVLREI